MAEIEEVKIEESKAEEMRIDNRVRLTKIYLGSGDDYIMVSGNDISVFDRFIAAGDRIILFAEDMDRAIAEIEKNQVQEKENDLSNIEKEIKIRKEFSEKAAAEMDSVFGEGTTRKFFGDIYAAIPNFVPDVECFMDFWDRLVPVVEKMFEHKVKLEKLASKKRMSKYQPQDHKKPQKKGEK